MFVLCKVWMHGSPPRIELTLRLIAQNLLPTKEVAMKVMVARFPAKVQLFGEFSRYRGHGPGRRMSPAICASLCWDDSTDESCEPLDDSAVDADCDFQRGDSTSCNAAVCAYTPPGTTRIPHTSFVIGRDGRCSVL